MLFFGQVSTRAAGERGMPRMFLYPACPASALLPERSRDMRQVQGQGGGLPNMQDTHGQLCLTGASH
jgi:hypothetical protein